MNESISETIEGQGQVFTSHEVLGEGNVISLEFKILKGGYLVCFFTHIDETGENLPYATGGCDGGGNGNGVGVGGSAVVR